MDCSLRQLLEVGFFHADPHPGNLVATKDGSLAYFDFGMMGDIPRHYRIGLIKVVRTSIHPYQGNIDRNELFHIWLVVFGAQT